MHDEITYDVIRSDRKSVSIEITRNGTVLVRAPLRLNDKAINDIVLQKADWIRKHRISADSSIIPFTKTQLNALKQQARADLSARAARIAPMVGVTYSRIAIRTQRTLWGSCSAKGNLNFNALLMLAPETVRDYVVVHELCHRKHLDHSAAFWAAVGKVMPDWKRHRQWLKEHGRLLLARLPQE